jgi:prepilin-type processing-associated H-X9-DG protein
MLNRHASKWNVVFCDGHAKSGKTDEFFRFSDDNVVRQWDIRNEARRRP